MRVHFLINWTIGIREGGMSYKDGSDSESLVLEKVGVGSHPFRWREMRGLRLEEARIMDRIVKPETRTCFHMKRFRRLRW